MARRIGSRDSGIRRGARGTVFGMVAGLVTAGTVLAGCAAIGHGCGSIAAGNPACTHGPTAAPGGLSREEAIAAARRSAPAASPDPDVVWASIENDPFVRGGTGNARRLVWDVRLQGSFAIAPCPSGFLDRPASIDDPACLDGDSGLIVVVDYYTGAFVGWLH